MANWKIKSPKVVCDFSYGGFLSTEGCHGEGLVVVVILIHVVAFGSSWHNWRAYGHVSEW